jgi:hypothetical protein
MEKYMEFTAADCLIPGSAEEFVGKVVVESPSSPPHEIQGQLYFCTSIEKEKLSAVSLTDGDIVKIDRHDMLGILKPELLPDSAKLQLSQIRPGCASNLRENEPQYTGYCFLQNGRYASGVALHNQKEVEAYIDMQKDYQHRVMVCDHEDFSVFEMVDGKLIYPSEEMLAEFAARQEQQADGGMQMNL